MPNHADIRDLSSLIKAVQDFSPARRKNFHFNIVKRRQRTHAASGGASEALPHEVGARPSRSEPKLNTHALYPSRSELRGITFKNQPLASTLSGHGMKLMTVDIIDVGGAKGQIQKHRSQRIYYKCSQ